MSITATELKMNLGKYLNMAISEDIYVTQYGKTIAVLTSPVNKKLETLSSLKGCLGQISDKEIDDEKYERLSKKCGF